MISLMCLIISTLALEKDSGGYRISIFKRNKEDTWYFHLFFYIKAKEEEIIYNQTSFFKMKFLALS